MSTIDGIRVLSPYHVIKFRARGVGIPRLGLDLIWNDNEKWHPEPVILTKDWLTYELRLDQAWHIKQGADGAWVSVSPCVPDRISTVVFFAGDGTSDSTVHGYVDIADVSFE